MTTKFKLNKLKKKTDTCSMDFNSKNKAKIFLTKAKLAMYMKRGLDIKDAARLCNVSDYQLGLLRSDPDFEQLIEYCMANCEHEHLNNINSAGELGQWQASAWMLERKFPDKYGKKDTVRHEYELKMLSFQKVVLNIINDLDPSVRQLFMQKLRNLNVESEVHDIKLSDNKPMLIDVGGN